MPNKHILREVPPEQTYFDSFFDNDGLTERGGDYCYNLFIVPQYRHSSGFNKKEYDILYSRVEELVGMYEDIITGNKWADYKNIEEMLLDQDLDGSFENFLEEQLDPLYGFWKNPERAIGEYLTLTTGKEWVTEDVYGYSQGDHVILIYCKEHYENARIYGEVWLGMAKEFTHTDGDFECGGYIVADCQVRSDEDYKRLLCEWIGIDEKETILQMIENRYTGYNYRTI